MQKKEIIKMRSESSETGLKKTCNRMNKGQFFENILKIDNNHV